MTTRRRVRIAAATTVAAVLGTAGAVTVAGSAEAQGNPAMPVFERTATYPVFQNRPVGEDPATETVAEISSVTKDGKTMIYTDAAGKRIGFLDISDPKNVKGLGTLSLAELGDDEDEPTSVTVVGDYVLVVVNTSPSFTAPSGRLDVVRISDRVRVRSIDLGGQPDSIAVNATEKYAAIAIENERDEDVAPAGGEDGDLPQLPAGFVQIVDLTGSVVDWKTRAVALTAADGSALPSFVAAGLDTPVDPEPEYVTINSQDQLALTLQENNGVVLIDLRSGKITKVFSAGTNTVTGIDTEDDGKIDRTGEIVDLPREPDGVSWIDDRFLATANEGDWKGGTRGWSIFDSRTGQVVWDTGNTLENIFIANGLHSESRADNKGIEIESVVVSTFNGKRVAFAGSERSNAVAVYDLTNPKKPAFKQLLPTTNGPEGLLPIPSRNLVAFSSETDDADANVRASVSLYQVGTGPAQFPQIAASSITDPFGWGALGALSAVPGKPNTLVSVTDASFTPTKIFRIDTSQKPARIFSEITVTDAAGEPTSYDAEGIFARPQGGFWLAVEGATGAQNKLVQLDGYGRTKQILDLPAEVTSALKSQGLEGVTATTDAKGEHVFFNLQRELSTDPRGVVRIGRYDVKTKKFTWFGYPIESTTTANDWIGLSEITVVDGDTLAVIERDKLNGPAAKIKRIYAVDLPKTDPAPGTLPVLEKKLAVDVLPTLKATNGWTQEKLEGLTIGGNGRVYVVTDNDAADDATGETVFADLGPASKIFK